MPIVGASASFMAAGAPAPGYVGLQIPGAAFLGLLALPGTALLISGAPPAPGPQWVGATASQTI
jgi:hypothetical protein